MTRFGAKVALVTGAAAGIGEATARLLACEGATVIVADIDLEAAKIVAKDIEGVAVEMDVASSTSVTRATEAAVGEVGAIDILVNNAGFDRMAYFLDTDEADWYRVLGVNLVGTMACTRAVLPSMYERRAGAIVNVASEAGHVGTVGGAAYSAAKGGVLGFTKAIAREAVHYGVRCNAVAPGPVDTALLANGVSAAGPRGAAIRQAMIDATVMGRLGQPAEIAAAIAFLASEDASFMTGQVVAVSGGLSMA